MTLEEELTRAKDQNAVLLAKNIALETELTAMKGLTVSACSLFSTILESVECSNDVERGNRDRLMSIIEEAGRFASR